MLVFFLWYSKCVKHYSIISFLIMRKTFSIQFFAAFKKCTARKTHCCSRGQNDWIKRVWWQHFMDFSKSYDCIPHDLLLTKLKVIHTVTLLWIYHHLSRHKERTKIGLFFSSWRDIIREGPQMSLLGPLLFNKFLNYLLFFSELACTQKQVFLICEVYYQQCWSIINKE